MDRTHGWVDRKDRRPTDVDARVRRADGSEIQVKLTDLSDEGCRIESGDEVLRIGEWLDIEAVPIGELKAQVRWALDGSAGVKFREKDEP
jgi:hypothetical protein